MKKIIKKLKKLLMKYFDYEITGEYYDRQYRNGTLYMTKKYNRKWHLRRRDKR